MQQQIFFFLTYYFTVLSWPLQSCFTSPVTIVFFFLHISLLYSNILIDLGKTFRDAVITVLLPLHVRLVDAILLTHDHADAMGGLDDVRDLQVCFMTAGEKLKS